jgi:putative tryptophan/tyrosine transport system substrate-binding protein
MNRREFIALTGFGTAAVHIALFRAARAQQPTPLIGFVHSLSSSYIENFAPAFRAGLAETGYVDGRNVSIAYRAADGRYDLLAGLVTDLIKQKAAVIVAAGGTEPAKVAQAATSAIPIVFVSAADPVKAGLIASLNRPGGNITGVSLIGSTLEAKRLEILNQLVPGHAPIGVLINPTYPDAGLQRRESEAAAGAMKRPIIVITASTDSEIEPAIAGLAQNGAGALLVAQDVFFNSRRRQLTTLATNHKLPTIYNQREYVEIGGLASYGTSFKDGYRQAGVLAGKILAGASPAEQPVTQPTKFEFVVNLRTAKALGLTLPAAMLAIADEVIE